MLLKMGIRGGTGAELGFLKTESTALKAGGELWICHIAT